MKGHPTRRPWIGVTTRWNRERRHYSQDQRYLDAVEWAGGVPVLIPLKSDPDLIHLYGSRLDGVLLTGNPSDVDPRHYGGREHQELGPIAEERDRVDFQLLEIAEDRALPVFGVCYGAQSLNVSRGGTLVQDIASEVPDSLPHNHPGKPQPTISHSVSIEPRSRLGTLLERGDVEVNSYHHQSVGEVGRNLRVVAQAPDGVIEAIEDSRDRFAIGVQWHPETSWETDPLARALFTGFVVAASETVDGRRG